MTPLGAAAAVGAPKLAAGLYLLLPGEDRLGEAPRFGDGDAFLGIVAAAWG